MATNNCYTVWTRSACHYMSEMMFANILSWFVELRINKQWFHYFQAAIYWDYFIKEVVSFPGCILATLINKKALQHTGDKSSTRYCFSYMLTADNRHWILTFLSSKSLWYKSMCIIHYSFPYTCTFKGPILWQPRKTTLITCNRCWLSAPC